MIPDDVAVMRSTLTRNSEIPSVAGLTVRDGRLRAIGGLGEWTNVTQAVSLLHLLCVLFMCRRLRPFLRDLTRVDHLR